MAVDKKNAPQITLGISPAAKAVRPAVEAVLKALLVPLRTHDFVAQRRRAAGAARGRYERWAAYIKLYDQKIAAYSKPSALNIKMVKDAVCREFDIDRSTLNRALKDRLTQ